MHNILDKTNEEAREYFLKSSSYCNIHLPEYFDFRPLLTALGNCGNLREGLNTDKAKKYDNTNYKFLTNKDGKYAWRPFQLIHPTIYVHLVNVITAEGNWAFIQNRFKEFQENEKIKCCSLYFSQQKGETILNWWQHIEQKSLEYSLYYDYLLNTDITDCYSSIYTHSIPWALHSKSVAKEKRNDRELLGNEIDKIIQSMQYGQTNGIPQGSSLMDFIAEIVLGYADLELSEKIENYNINPNVTKIENYQILRYRDDYRIFADSEEVVAKIGKLLSESLIELNLKINSQKTFISDRIVKDSIKSDKHYWNEAKQEEKTLQKHLLIIHSFAEKYANSGTLQKALDKFLGRVSSLQLLKEENSAVLISILIDIASQNPRTYPIIVAILSKILSLETDNEKFNQILNAIEKKFDKIPNTGHLQIWLQRLTYKYNPDKEYNETLCKKVKNKDEQIWENDWFKNNEVLQQIFNDNSIINTEKMKELPPIIEPKEVRIFNSY